VSIFGQFGRPVFRHEQLQSWVNRLTFERQNSEDALMCEPQWFSSDKALQRLGIRHEWTHRNPITKVRASAKRVLEPDVLSPAELSALISELPLREKAMVMLAGSTGLRRSELIALTWNDIDPLLIQVNVLRSCVRNHFGDTKTEASRRSVPLHSSVVECLNE
jgi:integrase